MKARVAILAFLGCLGLLQLQVFGQNTIPKAALSQTNLVRLQGKCLSDNTGPFLGLGASYFLALRDAKFERERLTHNLMLLHQNGFNYIRVFCMVGWPGLEVAPVT